MMPRPGAVPGLTPLQAKELLDGGDALLVDVREHDEWEQARIPGALHVPLGDLPQRVAELPKDRPLVLQCLSGGRSAMAAQHLLGLGFTRVHNLEGGIAAWHRFGLPVDQ